MCMMLSYYWQFYEIHKSLLRYKIISYDNFDWFKLNENEINEQILAEWLMEIGLLGDVDG